jgi:hypothetical protein
LGLPNDHPQSNWRSDFNLHYCLFALTPLTASLGVAIRLMNKYPKDWKNIAARVGERAGGRCQRCGVGHGELYTRFSGRVVSEKEFKRLGKTATRVRRQQAKERREAVARARAHFLSSEISEAEMAGDYDRGYFAEGGFYPIDNQPMPSELPRVTNNNRALHFEVHHIDGDKSNNKDDNLEYLCKRCHMFKHTDAT